MRATALALQAILVLSPLAAQADEPDAILITATKRPAGATLADAPLSAHVFGEDELRARNVEDLTSLSYAMANVQLEDIGTARGIANFSIRGIGVNSSIASVDPAVGLFVDGVYQGMNAGALTDLFDIEAVEVVRGPQGTLHGRNVTGGAVLVRTLQPTHVFEARGRVAIESGSNSILEAALSGPLAPGLVSGRLALYYADDRGWLENDFDGSRFGASETRAARAALRLTPTPDLEILFRAEQGFKI